jgi:hypothetical protein
MPGLRADTSQRDFYVHLLRGRAYPVQIILGEGDPGPPAHRIRLDRAPPASVGHIHRIPGKHFPLEDQSPASPS